MLSTSTALPSGVLAGLALLSALSCGPLRSIDDAVPPVMDDTTAPVHVQDRWLLVHLARPVITSAPPPVYVLYVTGDGGWNGKDVATFEHVRAWGRPVAGFSAPDYLDRLAGQEQTVPPQDLARDFGTILQATAARLGLAPDTPAVLVGVSRGADLVVIAAGEAAIAQRIAGVVAIALTDEEEYVRHPPRHVPHLGHSSSREPALEMARPYEYLPRIPWPTVLIQSTNDQYVPAARAAVQFGPQSALRRFYPIEARNHSFGGAREEMYRALRASLEWVATVRSIAEGPLPR
jgi:hypothetical protein